LLSASAPIANERDHCCLGTFILLRVILIPFIVCVMCFSIIQAQAQTPDVIAPRLGPYGRLDSYCGKDDIPKNPFSIPWIGCFYLEKWRVSIGDFLNHRVEVDVDPDGKEVFIVDNVTVVTTRDPITHKPVTNLPFVRTASTPGYIICEEDNSNCPARIEVFSRNPDKSVLFMVSECLPEHRLCASTQANWDYIVALSKRLPKSVP
jgi:hypothetical protein